MIIGLLVSLLIRKLWQRSKQNALQRALTSGIRPASKSDVQHKHTRLPVVDDESEVGAMGGEVLDERVDESVFAGCTVSAEDADEGDVDGECEEPVPEDERVSEEGIFS